MPDAPRQGARYWALFIAFVALVILLAASGLACTVFGLIGLILGILSSPTSPTTFKMLGIELSTPLPGLALIGFGIVFFYLAYLTLKQTLRI